MCLSGVFLLQGAAATLGQVLFVREFLVVAFGNELCLGLILFSWFLGVGMGAVLGGWTAPRVKEHRLEWLILLLLLMVLGTGVQITIIRSLRWILSVPPGEYLSLGQLAIGAWLGVFPFSILVGLIFPFAGQLARSPLDEGTPGGVSWVYVLEAAGSLAAGVLFSSLLVLRVSAFGVVRGLLALVAFIGLITLVRGSASKSRFALLMKACLIILLLLAAFFPTSFLENLTLQIRWRVQFPGINRIDTKETPYGRLDVAEDFGQYSIYGNGQLIATFPDPYFYLESVHNALVQHASPQRVLLVGGNPEMIRLILAHGVEHLDWVELNPALIELYFRYTPEEIGALLRHPRVRIIHEDGRRFIRQISRKVERRKSGWEDKQYDLILLDVPDPSTAQLNRYYTREFYSEVHRALKPDGVLATAIEASLHVTGDEVLGYGKVIYWTLQQVFPHLAAQPGQTYRFYASQAEGQVTEEAEVLQRRFLERGVEPAAFATLFRAAYQPDRVEELRWTLEQPPEPQPNTDFKPVAYLYQLLVWNRWAGSDLSNFLLGLKQRSPLWMLLAAAVLIAARLLFSGKRQVAGFRRFSLVLAVWILGLTSLSVNLILLFAFQNAFGVLYQKIALVIALFMWGLTMGGLLMKQVVEHLSNLRRERGLQLLILINLLFVLLLPLLLRLAADVHWDSALVFYVLVLLSGLFTGAGFPLAISLYYRPGEPVARAAGVIDSADHIGAMVGALLTGTFWLPLWGIATTCLILAGANALALGFLLSSPRK